MNKYLWGLISILSVALLWAKDFGNRAHYFPIQEESIQTYFAKQMQRPNFDSQAMAKAAANPKPVDGLTEAKKPSSHLYTPCYTAEENILDHKGAVIVKKGTSYNPLEYSQPSSKLLFIDGTNKAHVAWATAQSPSDKIILVKGSPIELESDLFKAGLKRPIYFDQMGCYATTFHIKHVPAKISAQGKSLLVEEVPISSSSNAKEVSNG